MDCEHCQQTECCDRVSLHNIEDIEIGPEQSSVYDDECLLSPIWNPHVLVPLHQYPEFTFPCATLLNMEWPRSRQSRLNGLWSCNRQFPVGMVLVQCESRDVIGFCKVSLIPGVPRACFIQSVVIHPEKRGQGLGSFLMSNLEEYLRSRKLKTLYLSTMGQEKFYTKLGYAECEPVSLYAFGLQTQLSQQDEEEETKKNHSSLGTLDSNFKKICLNVGSGKQQSKENINDKRKKKNNKITKNATQPPPPPPPPPKSPLGGGIMTVKTFMKKEI